MEASRSKSKDSKEIKEIKQSKRVGKLRVDRMRLFNFDSFVIVVICNMNNMIIITLHYDF
jgi:hypothetical protein